ncbi:MAG TPA: hypothetical protein VFY63_03570, partial [Pseudorhizobium sp.]|nr:hypothetical protein [Pseudorhizobium sp.]
MFVSIRPKLNARRSAKFRQMGKRNGLHFFGSRSLELFPRKSVRGAEKEGHEMDKYCDIVPHAGGW